MRKVTDADPWAFSAIICQEGGERDFVERFHRPLIYLQSGPRAAHLLAATLSLREFDSEVTRQIRKQLTERHIDWTTKDGLRKLRLLQRRVNNRIFRSSGKTTGGERANLWNVSTNPNLNLGIASKSDPAAEKMCSDIGKMMLRDPYIIFYGDRLSPKNPEGWITKTWIRMNGRTNPDGESIEARGIGSQWTLHHYDIINPDDIVGTESGEASTDDAIKFIEALPGISMADEWGGSTYIFNGTIYGPEDDNAILKRKGTYITIEVPIWTKTAEPSAANVKVNGVPTLPELYDFEACKAKRDETVNSELGIISWLQNFELTAHIDGVSLFSTALITQQTAEWVRDPRTKRWLIRRPMRVQDDQGQWTPVLDSKGDPRFVVRDPFTLPRAIGCDQAFSEKDWADKWALGSGCVDEYGHVYVLDCPMDKGYDKMIGGLVVVWLRWSGHGIYPIRKIGMESDATQGMTSDWLKRGAEFKSMARVLSSVQSGNVAKITRIYNNFSAKMQMGELWIMPENQELRNQTATLTTEMVKLRPGPGAKDNGCDAVAIMAGLLKSPVEVKTEEERDKETWEREREFTESHDTVAGLPLESWVEAASW